MCVCVCVTSCGVYDAAYMTIAIFYCCHGTLHEVSLFYF